VGLAEDTAGGWKAEFVESPIMLANAQDQQELAGIESQRLSVAIWRRFIEDFRGSHIEDRDAFTVLWANTPFLYWNCVFISETVHSFEQLKAATEEAVKIAATKKYPGLISVCLSLLDNMSREQADSILSAAGYPILLRNTGMTAGHFPIPQTCPASLRIERVNDFRILTELNAHAYGVPFEASTLSEQFAQDAFIYLGYEAERPVCTAAVIVQEDVLYLALVATHKSARGKGYGEAIVRHALQKAHEATNLTQTALHATTMGKPIYERIGFHPVANFCWYMQQHDWK
jgi:GNAT superfamily N-acetyltransferase